MSGARRGAGCVVVLTGAGVSADSGLPTFRGAGGLWEGHRAEELATPEAWATDPALVWRFYQMRRAALVRAEPNAAHAALAAFERRVEAGGGSVTLVTQNVDDLHARAGSRRLLPMHGELAHLRCERCGHGERNLAELDPERFVPCPSCAHVRLRPDVVWFGEMPRHLDDIGAALERATAFLSLGTSGVVYPAAGFLEVARARGARTWVQCLEAPANLDPRDRLVTGRAAEVLPELLGAVASEL